jgi:hypothetical protein
VQDLRFMPPSPPAPAEAPPSSYARPGLSAAPRSKPAPLAVPNASASPLREELGRAAHRDLYGPSPQPLHQHPHSQQPAYGRQPPPPPLQPAAADYAGGRWSNGSDHSDPATVPWHSMPAAQQQQQSQWEQQQQPHGAPDPGYSSLQPLGAQQHAQRGGWDPPLLSAKYPPSKPNQFARQASVSCS